MNKVLTFGVYDYFHLGHLRFFKQCKLYGDYLTVAVQDSNYILKFKPHSKILYTTSERVEMLEAIRLVDKVLVYDAICIETISKLEFDVLALGEDHIGDRFDDIRRWCEENGRLVVRLKRTPNISSTDIKYILNS